LDLVKDPKQALDDLRLTQTLSADMQLPFGTTAQVLTDLRRADPGRKNQYPSFCALEQPARYILQGKNPSDRMAEFLSLQERKRSPAELLPHAQGLDIVRGHADGNATTQAYHNLLQRYEKSEDPHLRQALEDSGTQANSAAVLHHFDHLARVAKRC